MDLYTRNKKLYKFIQNMGHIVYPIFADAKKKDIEYFCVSAESLDFVYQPQYNKSTHLLKQNKKNFTSLEKHYINTLIEKRYNFFDHFNTHSLKEVKKLFIRNITLIKSCDAKYTANCYLYNHLKTLGLYVYVVNPWDNDDEIEYIIVSAGTPQIPKYVGYFQQIYEIFSKNKNSNMMIGKTNFTDNVIPFPSQALPQKK